MKFSSPYHNRTFKSIWLKHFRSDQAVLNQDCFVGVEFCKSKPAPLYINVGGTNTKGMPYGIKAGCDHASLRNKVFLIYDVPGYLNPTFGSPNRFKLLKIPQYPGYLCDFGDAINLEEYLEQQISKRTGSKLRNYQNRLNRDHKVSYKMVWGDIGYEGYEELFEQFHALLVKRFKEKQIVNNNLDPAEWQFYKEVSFPMLKSKEAGLFVTCIGDRPAGITLLNFSVEHVYDVIRVFDIAYSTYRIGSLGILKQMEWCLANGFKILDFSKGHYDYKKQWSNREYVFQYHIRYDSRSPRCFLVAMLLALKFYLKFWARKYNVQETVHKLRYRLRPKD